jgi:hypothetical protein
MPGDDRNLLEVLKSELGFLEAGGYEKSSRAAWRARLVFEDSPTCMKYNAQQDERPCGECVLAQLVPLQQRERKILCRYISLTPEGKTLDFLYAYGTQPEIREALAEWLCALIQHLEDESTNAAPAERMFIQIFRRETECESLRYPNRNAVNYCNV